MNIDPSEKNDQVINVPCTMSDKAMARQLAENAGLNMSHIIRQAIRTLHDMTFSNAPRCATGAQCLCPAMHQVRAPSTLSPAERVIAAQRSLDASNPQGN